MADDNEDLIFTKGRKKFVAKNCTNAIAVILASAFASEFFAKFPLVVRLGVAIFAVVLILIGFASSKEVEDE